MREAYDARLAEAAANAGRWANATPEDHAGNRERLAEAQAKGERRIRELNEMQAYYSRKWPWAEIITASLWIILFVFLLPYEFRDNAWPWLTVKILGSVLTSAILPATFLVPIYLVLKSQ
jgi:hypothetical protein